MTEWFLVQLKPNAHGLAERNLRRQGFEVFLPLTRVSRRKANSFVVEKRPLFRGYMFVALDPSAADWRKVASSLGVTRILTMDGRPQPVQETLIDELRARCDADGVFQPVSELKVGDRVQVVSGPFASFLAEVETVDERGRVGLLLNLVGQVARLALDRTAVRSTPGKTQ